MGQECFQRIRVKPVTRQMERGHLVAPPDAEKGTPCFGERAAMMTPRRGPARPEELASCNSCPQSPNPARRRVCLGRHGFPRRRLMHEPSLTTRRAGAERRQSATPTRKLVCSTKKSGKKSPARQPMPFVSHMHFRHFQLFRRGRFRRISHLHRLANKSPLIFSPGLGSESE